MLLWCCKANCRQTHTAQASISDGCASRCRSLTIHCHACRRSRSHSSGSAVGQTSVKHWSNKQPVTQVLSAQTATHAQLLTPIPACLGTRLTTARMHQFCLNANSTSISSHSVVWLAELQPWPITCQGASVQEPAAAGQPLLRPPHWDHAWTAFEQVGATGGGGGVGLGVHIHLHCTVEAFHNLKWLEGKLRFVQGSSTAQNTADRAAALSAAAALKQHVLYSLWSIVQCDVLRFHSPPAVVACAGEARRAAVTLHGSSNNSSRKEVPGFPVRIMTKLQHTAQPLLGLYLLVRCCHAGCTHSNHAKRSQNNLDIVFCQHI